MISIQGLNYRYGDTAAPALDNISLEIPAAGTFGLLGPNGAGKSTLLSILNGLLPVPRGRIRIADMDAGSDMDSIRRISSLVPQDYAFYDALSGRENLEFFAGIYALDEAARRRRIDYCIEVGGLSDIIDRRAGAYSGGMKRRLNFALGLLNAPRILYLDEPTVGVDALSRQLLLDAVKQLTRDGVTVVYISHYMEEVQAVCNEVAVINRGRVLLRDKVHRELDAATPRRLHVWTQAPVAQAVLDELGQLGFSSETQFEAQPEQDNSADAALSLDITAADLSPALAILDRHSVSVQRLSFGTSRLEEVYMNALRDDVS